MTITNVKIKHFRSIREQSFQADKLTVFVGGNDEGKSNLLRALDLFFNDRPGGYRLEWAKDFSAYHKTSDKKAPEITIEVTFDIPLPSIKKPVTWKKIWRKNGLEREIISHSDGTPLPPRTKTTSYLKEIRFNYVPAIKGPEYFKQLLASVHDMLDSTVRNDIRGAAEGFTKEIRKHTKGILSQLDKQLGLKSEIELPPDLRQLFSDLEFTSKSSGHSMLLSQRGDGIKVRHIPVILRWLAQQANYLQAQGKPSIDTIWGYEEPENNLEIKRCFELSEYFLDASNSIQVFLTTHSPVFYSTFAHAPINVNLMEVARGDKDLGTILIGREQADSNDLNALHSSVGFLELLDPHIRHYKIKISELEKKIDKSINTEKPTIFVEGPSDKVIIEAAIDKFFNGIKTRVRVICSTANGGGHAWVKDQLISWGHSRTSNCAVGLFDNDAGGKSSFDEFNNTMKTKATRNSFAIRVQESKSIKKARKVNIKIPATMDEIVPLEFWSIAEKQGWLEERKGLPVLYSFSETNRTFNDWLKEKIPDRAEQIQAFKKISSKNKKEFSGLFAKELINPKSSTDFTDIKDLVSSAISKLKI